MEAERGHWIPQNWNYKWSWATMWMMEIEPSSQSSQPSSHLSCLFILFSVVCVLVPVQGVHAPEYRGLWRAEASDPWNWSDCDLPMWVLGVERESSKHSQRLCQGLSAKAFSGRSALLFSDRFLTSWFPVKYKVFVYLFVCFIILFCLETEFEVNKLCVAIVWG